MGHDVSIKAGQKVDKVLEKVEHVRDKAAELKDKVVHKVMTDIKANKRIDAIPDLPVLFKATW